MQEILCFVVRAGNRGRRSYKGGGLSWRGMKVSRNKTECMCVNERDPCGRVRLQGEEIKKVDELKKN